MRVIITTLIALAVFLIICLCVHAYKYTCVRGHYENKYYYDPALKMTTRHPSFVCDQEVLREDYAKLKKEDCNCE